MLAISVAGGDNQDQMTLQLLLNHIDFGLEPAASVVAPRFMTDHFISSFRQTPPALGQLRINPEIGAETLDAFKARGHVLSVSTGPLAAAPSVIAIETTTGQASRRRRSPRRPACDGVLKSRPSSADSRSTPAISPAIDRSSSSSGQCKLIPPPPISYACAAPASPRGGSETRAAGRQERAHP